MKYNSLALVAFKLSKEQPEKGAIHKQGRLFKLLLQTYRVLKRIKFDYFRTGVLWRVRNRMVKSNNF